MVPLVTTCFDLKLFLLLYYYMSKTKICVMVSTLEASRMENMIVAFQTNAFLTIIFVAFSSL